MTPNTEPNSIPTMFADRQEWRETYWAYVEEFKASERTKADEGQLSIRLMRLGFIGVNLENELKYVKENS